MSWKVGKGFHSFIGIKHIVGVRGNVLLSRKLIPYIHKRNVKVLAHIRNFYEDIDGYWLSLDVLNLPF